MFSIIYRLYSVFRHSWEKIINILFIKYFGVHLAAKPKIIRGVLTIRSAYRGSICIGENIEINSGEKYNLVGGDVRMILRTVDKGSIIIGDNVAMSNSAIVSGESITIEDKVMIGGGCRIWDTDFHSLDIRERTAELDSSTKTSPILIKEGSFIGGGSIILKGVTIGKKSIVGAGSVVSKSIPDYEIWAGNPAKKIRSIN